jgi:cellulose synthase (UDP-forming)
MKAQPKLAEQPRAGAREWISRAAGIVALIVGVDYVAWRFAVTLNPAAMWLSLPVWLAELYGLLSTILFTFIVWGPIKRRLAAPPARRLSVDIFVPTYDEPVWIVRRTLLGARAVRYPHTTYLLDDGNRPEMAALAQQLGCKYLARGHNADAKAGNLNFGLAHSRGTFIAIFDADHIPMPEFLDRTLGYFADPTVAFVQTPQEFYNIDSYQHRVDLEHRRTWHEQALFYRVIQPGKDRWNAAFFCGSCAVVRRAAVKGIGGFATGTVTEDLHTSIRLHARGWRSQYHNEVLAYGLAPQTAIPYHVQRLRWGQGAMQIFRKDQPLLIPGLTLAQRLNYLSSMTTYFDGWQKLIFYLAPPIYLLTGILPIRTLGIEFVIRFLIYYVASFIAFKLSCRGYGMALLTEGYNMARYYTYIKTTFGLVAGRRLRFAVTQKDGRGRVPLAMAAPQLAVIGFTSIAMTVGGWRLFHGAEHNPGAFWGNVLWSSWNLGLGAWAALLTLRSIETRGIHRAHVGLPVSWKSGRARGVGVLLDLHEDGGGLLVRDWKGPTHRVRVELLWPPERILLVGEIRWTKPGDAGVTLGLRWIESSVETIEQVGLLVTLFAQRQFLRDLDRPRDRLGSLELPHRRRKEVRERLRIPVRLEGEAPVWGVTEDLSPGGARILLPSPVPRGSKVRLRLWGGVSVVAGTVLWVQRLELAPYVAYRVALSRQVKAQLSLGGKASRTTDRTVELDSVA